MKKKKTQSRRTGGAVPKKRREKKPPRGPGWTKALDVNAYDQYLAAVFYYVRVKIKKLSLTEVERRSDVCRQFWRKVERAVSHPSTHTEVPMCNALRVRPSVLHRLAERWLRQGRKLVVLLLSGCPYLSADLLVMEGV